MIEGSKLKLDPLTKRHAGAYICIANNGIPPTVSKRVLLQVACKSIIIIYYTVTNKLFQFENHIGIIVRATAR